MPVHHGVAQSVLDELTQNGGLVKCRACGRALSDLDAKSGQFSYYVCQAIMKRGKDACVTPRLNARRFEQMIVDKIRSNILTEGSII